MVPTFPPGVPGAARPPWYGKLERAGKPHGLDSGEQCSAGRGGLNKVALFGVILLSCFPLRGAEGVWHRISCTHTHTHTRVHAHRFLTRRPAWVNRGTFTWGGICHTPPMTAPGGTSACPGAGCRPCTIAQQGPGVTRAVRSTWDGDEASGHHGPILTAAGRLLTLPSTKDWEPSLHCQPRCIQKIH